MDSKNTDGISLLNSTDVVVRNSVVDTGDDNVAVKEGTRRVLINHCNFRNGHGSSIGSLGEGGSFGEVRDIVMRNIVFNQTVNAARIKTWQVSEHQEGS
jgi:polygalacturonase